MRKLALALVLAVTGCFDPSPSAGLPCPNGWCPPPQACGLDGYCTGGGPTTDAAPTTDGPTSTGTPHVSASPGPAYMYPQSVTVDAYASGLTVTLASDDPNATIYYTMNGTTPSMTSTSGASPVSIQLPGTTSSTRLRYFAADGAAPSQSKDETFKINTTFQTYYGYLFDGVTFNGKPPVLDVKPGGQVHVVCGHLQVWSSGASPRMQLVYGLHNTADGNNNSNDAYLGCAYDDIWTAYPGTQNSLDNTPFDFAAPMASGTYEVRFTQIYDADCQSALMDTTTLASRQTVVRIGVLFVK